MQIEAIGSSGFPTIVDKRVLQDSLRVQIDIQNIRLEKIVQLPVWPRISQAYHIIT